MTAPNCTATEHDHVLMHPSLKPSGHPEARVMNTPLFAYRIDRRDQIVSVGAECEAFATQNGAPHLTERTVLGMPLWTFVHGSETRHLYRLLVDRVRNERSPIEFPFRCDSPDVRRLMQMKLVPLINDHVEFRVRIIDRHPRSAPNTLLTPPLGRSRLFDACVLCHCVNTGANGWLDCDEAENVLMKISETPARALMHCVCPECWRQMNQRSGHAVMSSNASASAV